MYSTYVVESLIDFCNLDYHDIDGYYVAYKPITLSHISFMFIKIKFIHCHFCVIFVIKSMSICNDLANYDEIYNDH